jgi:hypothetical protein
MQYWHALPTIWACQANNECVLHHDQANALVQGTYRDAFPLPDDV